MAKTHLIKDESLGGILREFIEVDLEPTDIVVINGERFRMVDRKAKVGDKVIIVNAENTYGKYRNGSVIYVEDVTVYGIYNDDVRADYNNVYGIIGHDEYRVLEPVASDDLVIAEEGVDKSVIELLANLARRITSLEQQMEANTKDIAYLDERTRSTSTKPCN